MELSSKSKTIKKKHKKRKIQVTDSSFNPIIKPETFDGICNWKKMQKVLGPVTDVKTKKPSGDKTSVIGIKPNPKDYKVPFTHKQKHHAKEMKHSSLQANKTESIAPSKNASAVTAIRSYSSVVSNGLSNSSGHSNVISINSQSDEFSFNFSGRKDASANLNSGHGAKLNEIIHEKSGMKLTKAVAMDCEMVGVGPNGEDSVIARVSIVNSFGDCLYDEFVKNKEKVTDYRTVISGVRPSDLKKGLDLYQVQKDVLEIINGRILVGHSIKHDLDVLFLNHPRHLIRDTAYYKPFRELCGGRTPSLKKLTSIVLSCEIQKGEHSSVEDAQAAMLLYLRQRNEWEKHVRSLRKRKPKLIQNNQSVDS